MILASNDPSKQYTPHCTILHRCGDDVGCCLPTQTCAASKNSTVELYFFVSIVFNDNVIFVNIIEIDFQLSNSKYSQKYLVPVFLQFVNNLRIIKNDLAVPRTPFVFITRSLQIFISLLVPPLFGRSRGAGDKNNEAFKTSNLLKKCWHDPIVYFYIYYGKIGF